MDARGRNTCLSCIWGGSSVPNLSVETGFKAALRIIPCCDLMGEIEGFEHSLSEAI